MKTKSIGAFLLLIALAATSALSFAAGEKGHAHEESEKNEKPHEDGEDSHEEEGDGHGHDEDKHGEEENSSFVGPDKGVLVADERTGIKLSPEAIKNFEIKIVPLSGAGPWNVPQTAVVTAEREVTLFRVRDGFFKRIGFKSLSTSKNELRIESKELRAGDQILVQGTGFVRVAEIAAFGGAAEGHAH
mgnify:CR=1 FL=1